MREIDKPKLCATKRAVARGLHVTNKDTSQYRPWTTVRTHVPNLMYTALASWLMAVEQAPNASPSESRPPRPSSPTTAVRQSRKYGNKQGYFRDTYVNQLAIVAVTIEKRGTSTMLTSNLIAYSCRRTTDAEIDQPHSELVTWTF